jgi:lipopolysaccharide biosynthesis glycosyltransferase
MKRIILGVVNEGEQFSGMSILSLWVNLQSLTAELQTLEEPHQIAIYVVSKDKNSLFCQFALELSKDTKIIAPSPWESYSFPPMMNGSHATYWKFDLINSVGKDEILIYLDADAFIVGKFELRTILSRVQKESKKDLETILMVPSHRSVFERVGYHEHSSPYAYFNAGLIIGTNFSKVEFYKLQEVYNDYYFAQPSRLIWHDQDLFNSYYGEAIHCLPLRYNISSGMLNKKNFDLTLVNYLGEEEFTDVVVAHASGRILFTKRHYTYRKLILDKGQLFIESTHSNSNTKEKVIAFLNLSRISTFRNQCNYFQNYFSRSGMKLFSKVDRNFLLFRIKELIKGAASNWKVFVKTNRSQ